METAVDIPVPEANGCGAILNGSREVAYININTKKLVALWSETRGEPFQRNGATCGSGGWCHGKDTQESYRLCEDCARRQGYLW